MKKNELGQIRQLRIEIAMDEERIEALRAKAEKASATLTGVPGRNGSSDRVGEMATLIAERENILRGKRIRLERELARLERYIADVPDSMIRQCMTRHFVDGWTWVKTAIEAGVSEDAVKKACYRYIKNESCPKCPEKM